jgi:hypothetical protein
MYFPKPELLPYAENIMEAAGQLFVDENLKKFKTNNFIKVCVPQVIFYPDIQELAVDWSRVFSRQFNTRERNFLHRVDKKTGSCKAKRVYWSTYRAK